MIRVSAEPRFLNPYPMASKQSPNRLPPPGLRTARGGGVGRRTGHRPGRGGRWGGRHERHGLPQRLKALAERLGRHRRDRRRHRRRPRLGLGLRGRVHTRDPGRQNVGLLGLASGLDLGLFRELGHLALRPARLWRAVRHEVELVVLADRRGGPDRSRRDGLFALANARGVGVFDQFRQVQEPRPLGGRLGGLGRHQLVQCLRLGRDRLWGNRNRGNGAARWALGFLAARGIRCGKPVLAFRTCKLNGQGRPLSISYYPLEAITETAPGQLHFLLSLSFPGGLWRVASGFLWLL